MSRFGAVVAVLQVVIAAVALLVRPSVAATLRRPPAEMLPIRHDVADYGAVGDGRADDTEAFLKAWGAVCSAPKTGGAFPVLLAPGRKRYLLKPVTFRGPCASDTIDFQIMGDVVAPGDVSAWGSGDQTEWIVFDHVDGLTVWGIGTVNGNGNGWWQRSCKRNPGNGCIQDAPTAMKFNVCSGIRVMNVRFVDSQQKHLGFVDSQWVTVAGVHITAPATSPNTDGIHLERTQHVDINHAVIGTGDDCISIGNGTTDVNITAISCGPGHGISVGSLGKDGGNVFVEDIRVHHVQFIGTTNGARIKTCPGATGYAKGISFQHLQFHDVQNPIVIDQFYYDNVYEVTDNVQGGNSVQISDVTYKDADGTSNTSEAVFLKCSPPMSCSSLVFSNINITSSDPTGKIDSVCQNANGDAQGYVYPQIPCIH